MIVIPGSAARLEVGEVRYWNLNGLAWQHLATALCDVLAVVWWTLVAGLVAYGGCWYVGRLVYGEWVREHPPPRLRFLAERRLRRDLARGLADLEAYLSERDPVHVNETRPGRVRTWSRQVWRRH